MSSRRLLLLLPLAVLLSCEPTLKESPVYGPQGTPGVSSANLTPPPTSCGGCALAPTTFVRTDGKTPILKEFPGDSLADYLLIVQDDGQEQTAAEIRLNGELIVAKTALAGFTVAEIKQSVKLKTANRLTVLPVGKVGAKVTVWILGGAKLVDSRGGVIRSPGGTAALTIPAGALSTPVQIEVVQDSSLSSPPPHGARFLGSLITLRPSGLAFSIPLTLTVPIPRSLIAIDSVGLAYLSDADGRVLLLEEPSTVDIQSNTLRGTITHFSSFQLIYGWIFKFQAGAYTYETTSYPVLAPPSGIADFDADVDRAMTAWNYYLAPKGISFAPNSSSASPDIEIASGQVSTCYFYLLCLPSGADDYAITGWDLLNDHRVIMIPFDPQKPLNNVFWPSNILPNGGHGGNAASILAHELGHALGLYHFNRACDDLSNPIYAGPQRSDCYAPPMMATLGGVDAPFPIACEDVASLEAVYKLGLSTANCASNLQYLAGDGQVASPGAVTAIPPTLKVVDKSGNPVGGVAVVFEVYAGGGSLQGRIAVSNMATGIAQAGSWTMGTAGTPQEVRARLYAGSESDLKATYSSFVAFHAQSVTGGGGQLPAWCTQVNFTGGVTGLPAGWSLQSFFGSNGGLSSGKLQSFNGTAWRLDASGSLPSGVSSVVIQYNGFNGNVLTTNSGMGRAVDLDMASGIQEIAEFNDRYQPNEFVYRAQMPNLLWPTPTFATNFAEVKNQNISYGVYQYTATLSDSSVTWTSVGPSTIPNTTMKLPGFLLSNIRGFHFGVSSPDNTTYAGNLSVTCN